MSHRFGSRCNEDLVDALEHLSRSLLQSQKILLIQNFSPVFFLHSSSPNVSHMRHNDVLRSAGPGPFP